MNMMFYTLLVLSAVGLVQIKATGTDDSYTAICEIKADSGLPDRAITGTIRFVQKMGGGATTITGVLSGFDSTIDNGMEKGFHIHASGSLGHRCGDAGAHYNPENKLHGGPSAAERHVGDLGNVLVETNRARVDIVDQLVKLTGHTSVIGKSMLIHAGRDDLGLGGEADSQRTGHAGGPWGCCIITDTTPRRYTGDIASGATYVQFSVPVFLACMALLI